MKRRGVTFGQRVAMQIQGGRSLFGAVFSSTWSSLGSWIGSYDAVDPRNVAMRGVIANPMSAADLTQSLPYIRNLCRNYERNNPTMRAGTEGLCANVVGSGIALEPDTGDEETDAKIREQWNDFIRDCFVDRSGLYEGQTLGFREVVIAGELVWRFVIDYDRVKDGRLPICILPLESEWLGNLGNGIVGMTSSEVAGVVIDNLGRPIAYNLRSPTGAVDQVPAGMVVHTFEKRRALQVRGEPWWAPVLTTLRQEKDLVTAELEAAKNTASFSAALTLNGAIPADLDEKGDPVRDLRLGQVMELQQGEKIEMLSHTRPSQQIAPFRSMLRGDIAGAIRLARRWLDRDLSQANYSSMVSDNQDSDRLLGPVRHWYGHGTAGRIYVKVLPYLAAKANVPMPRPNYKLLPDGQPFVDPKKDAEGAAMAVAFGLSTMEAEVSKRGGDWKQVFQQRAKEIEEAKRLGIALTTPGGEPWGDPEAVAEMASAAAKPAQEQPAEGLA